MRKVLKFVKGRREDKKDHGSSSLGPFAMEISAPSAGTPGDDDHYMPFDHGYIVDISGKDKTFTKLHKAAWLGNLDKLKVNLKKIDIDSVDKSNRTPLHLASARGHTNLVWFLLNNKAKMTICDNEGKTPFLKAIECGHKDLIQLMLEKGVDLTTVDYSGNSGLHISAKQGLYEIASILLKEGAHFETSNIQGEFPLHIATWGEHKDLVELLIRYGSSVNVVDRDHRSPLMFAAKNGNMPLVQLFLDNGAQRRVMDSHDWTAEDYALQGKHLDVAAELKSSPSDRVQSLDEDLESIVIPSDVVSLSRRSISPAAAVSTDKKKEEPDKREVPDKSKEDLSDKKSKDLPDKKKDDPDSDTWDSQSSEASSKPAIPGLRLMKFLPPSSDDEISEESVQSPMADAKDSEGNQDSPRSCVIPPPCKPPRSWDLIQAGMIDDINASTEPRRRSLLTLGSLRSKRESFTESPNAESPSSQVGQGDGPWLASHSLNKQDSLLQHCSSFDSRSNKSSSPSKSKVPSIEIEGKELKLQDDCEKVVDVYPSRGSLDVSDSESDWDSDASLPMDTLPITTAVISTEGNDRLSPIIILETISDDLEDTTNNVPVAVSDKKSRVLLRVPPIDLTDEDVELGKEMEREKDRSDSSDGDRRLNLSSSGCGTLGRDGTLQGYDEVWETNPQVSEDNVVLSRPSSSSPLALDNTTREKSNEKLIVEDELLFPSPQLCERSIEEDSLDSVKQLSISGSKMKMSTSLDFKKQTLATYLEGSKNNNQKYESHSLDNLDDVDGKPKVPKRHSRQMSVACQPWKSEELWQKPTLPPPPPISLDRMLADNKRINAQLECYDEALRELAQVKIIKKPTNSNEPQLTRYSGTKNHRYLSLPRTNELIDEAFKEMGQSSVSTIQRGSLSLPRSATAKDMTSEPVQDLESAERGSSLPRTITPKDMILESDPVPPPRRRKSLQTKNRTDSDGEKSGKEFRNRPLSLDIKYHLHNIDNQTVRLPKSHTMGFDSSAGDENVSPNVTSSRRTSIEKPIRKKRKTLLAMRGLNHESLNNSQSSVVSVEESFDEQPFMMESSDGLLPRQCTVIERKGFVPVHTSSPRGEEPSSPGLREENERLSLEYDAELDLPPPPPEAFCSPVADGKLDQSESLDNPRYSPSDESGMSQNDVTPQHSYTMKSHHSLLKQHLRETTAEKSRLEETAADLGEKTEKLKYELADAREASRSRDEVIALLQGQLKRMEEMYTECLEEIQGYRLRLGNQEQELRHLKDVCNKFDEEKENLNEIIRANEEEKADLDKALAVNGEERVLEITIQLREKEKEHQEMKIHLLHLEEEKQKSLEEIESLEKKNLELEEKLDRSVSKIRILGEEKAGLTVQSSGSQEESRKWQELYESCLMRLEQLATNCSVEVRDVKISADDFRDELRGINEKLLQMKGQYDLVCQERTDEQFVASDNQQLEELVEKLETDLKESKAKQFGLEIELQETRSELTEARKLMHEKESSTLFEELKKVNVELRQQSEQTRSQIDFRDEDLKVKLNSLNDLNQSVTSLQGTLNFLEDLHRSKDEIQARFDRLVKEKSDTDQQLSHLQAWVVEIQRLKECEAKAREAVSTQTDADQTENNLRSELKDLRHRCDELERRETKTSETQTTCEIVPQTKFDTLSQDYANQEAELERSLVVLEDARTAMNTTEVNNRALREELEELKPKIEKYQQEIEEYRKKPPCTCDGKKVVGNIPNIKVTVRVLKENEQEREKPNEVSSDVKCQDEEEIRNFNLESKENIKSESNDTLPSNEILYSRVVTGISGGSLNNKEAIQEETKEVSSQQELCSNSTKKLDVLTKEVDDFPLTVDNVNDDFNKTRTLFTRSIGIGTTDSCSSMGLIHADQSSILFQVHNLEKKSTVAGIELVDSTAGVDLTKKSTTGLYEEPEAGANASLRSMLQLDKERMKDNEKLIKDLKDEIVWLKTCPSQEKQSDGSIGHKTSCSNDEEFRKKVCDLEQKVREENNKRFALEVQVNKMKYDLQEKLKLENELVVLRNRLERDFVSRYELDHLRKSYEAALNRPKSVTAVPRPSPCDEDNEDHVVRNKLRDSLANQSAGEQRLQEARLKLRSEVASAEVTCSFVKDKRDELVKQSQASQEKKDRDRQRQIIERAYNKQKAIPVINLDKPLPVHRKCSASCSLCNSQHPMPCPGHTVHLKPTLSPGNNILTALAPNRSVLAQGHSDQLKSTLNLRQSKSQESQLMSCSAMNTTYTDSYRAMARYELDKSIRKHSEDSPTAVAQPSSSKALEEEEISKHHENRGSAF